MLLNKHSAHLPFRSVKTAVLAVGALSLFLAGCSDQGAAEQQAAGPAPQGAQQALPVDVMNLAAQQIPRITELTGRTHAYAEAEVRPQVTGIIEARLFTEGQYVEKGDPLYKIEDSEYRAALQSAQANLSSAKASARSAGETEDRFKRLSDLKAVSKEDYNSALAAAEVAEAQIGVAQAAVTTAQINLRRTEMKAPISGQIGRSSVTQGALVTANQTNSLARISQLDPIYLDMTASSSELLEWKRQVASGRIVTSEDSNAVPVTVRFQDGEVYPHEGELEFSEVNVDEAAGTVIVRAKVPNPEGLLLPGMFLQADFEAGAINEAFLVPQRAVQRDARSNPFVYVVNDGQAEMRQLTLEGNRGSNWVVTGGLESGEQVIVSGFSRLQDGLAVQPSPVDQTAADTASAATQN